MAEAYFTSTQKPRAAPRPVRGELPRVRAHREATGLGSPAREPPCEAKFPGSGSPATTSAPIS